MNTIFVGGSRHVSRLPPGVTTRLENVIASRYRIIVGDANGADKAVQKYFFEKHYDRVTVFCSGPIPRNNLGAWPIRSVDPGQGAKGFHFYAAKDREMASEADFGLMIWDGKSPGTVLNVLRLVIARKIAVLFDLPQKEVSTIKTLEAWKAFMSRRSRELNADVKERATTHEWSLVEGGDQVPYLTPLHQGHPRGLDGEIHDEAADTPSLPLMGLDDVVRVLNAGFARGDATAITDTLGTIARERGMSHVARETGLARESLYRSLASNGNPEFATVLKVLSSIGLRLEAKSDRKRARSTKSARLVSHLQPNP